MNPIDEQVVLDHFGIGADALLGEGGEARVFALDAERVVRIPHAGTSTDSLDARRKLLDAIAGTGVVALPEVLEHRTVADRLVVVERRLPGRDALHVLAEDGTDRGALIRHHLDVAASVARLAGPTGHFGELWGQAAIAADTFRDWASARLEASLRRAGGGFAHIDAAELTDDLISSLPASEPAAPVLVHLDAFLGNMLADGDRITALLDFGAMTIGGPPDLDPLATISYLAPEITPTSDDDDRAEARAWAAERGLRDALGPAERWLAGYWAFATDDVELHRWCRRILGSP